MKLFLTLFAVLALAGSAFGQSTHDFDVLNTKIRTGSGAPIRADTWYGISAAWATGANALVDGYGNPVVNAWTFRSTRNLSVYDPTLGQNGFTHVLAFPQPTATRTVTVPDASGTMQLSGFSGQAYNASGGATVTLTAAKSGQTFLFDAATGISYTLPAPAVGLYYNFIATVSVTSNSHEIQTSANTVFIEGAVAQIGSSTTFGFAADGSTILAVKMNGTTKGGLIGTQYTVTCVSATEWMITGTNVASGTASTPFTATP